MDTEHISTQSEVIQFINKVPLLAGVGIHEQMLLASKFHKIHYDAEKIVVEQGEIGDKLYVIIKGRVLVSIRSVSKGWVVINKLNPGDVFGEIAVLRDIPRVARVTTEVPCLFYYISAKDFLEIYHYFPPKARDNIQLVISKRLEQNKFWQTL